MIDIAITGIGPVTSIGIGREAFWEGAVSGRSGGRRIDLPEEILATIVSRIGAPVTGFDPLRYGIPEKDLEILDPASQFALAATALALDDAGWTREEVDRKKGRWRIVGVDPGRVAVVLGTGI